MDVVSLNMMFGMSAWNPIEHIRSRRAYTSHDEGAVRIRSGGYLYLIVSSVLNWQPDVICSQEVPLTIGKVTEQLAQAGYQVAVNRCGLHPAPVDIGVVVATKSPHDRIKFELPDSSVYGGGGGSLAVYLPERELTVVTVHFGLTKEMRTEQFRQLTEFGEEQRELGRKLLIAGDFNSGIDSQNPLVAQLGLRFYSPRTWPAWCPVKLRYDGICISSDCGVFLETGTQRTSSDHLLVHAKINKSTLAAS